MDGPFAEHVVPFLAVFTVGAGVVAGLAAGIASLMILAGRPVTFERVLDRVVIVVAILLGLALIGCSTPRPPCLTGFEVGVNGGETSGQQFGDRYNGEYVGGHATMFFDTTGACRAEE